MDLQRIVAFVVLSFSILMLWQNWQEYSNPKPADVMQSEDAKEATSTAMPTPGQSLQTTVKNQSGPAVGQVRQGARAIVKTDVLTATIDANGGDIRELILHHYRQNDDKTQAFRLFEERTGRNYFAQSGFIGEGLVNHKTVYQLIPGVYVLKPGQENIKLSMRVITGSVEVIKTYTFSRGSYTVSVDYMVKNNGTASIQGFPYYQLVRHGQAPEGESAFVYTFTGPAVFTEEGKFQKVNFSELNNCDNQSKTKTGHVSEATDGWIGMIQHHFVSAWLTGGHTDKSRREFYACALEDDFYRAGLILPALDVAPGQTGASAMRLYAGPQEQEKLKSLAPGLEHVVDYGWLTVLAYPLFVLLNWLEDMVKNWGVAIILLTVIIKLVFYPLSAASYKSMAQMRKLAPRLQNLKERYGEDRQKMHEAMMKIYQEEKINPLGGCLPILVQIPVFIALYWVLLSAVELRQAPFALWINDLSEPDPYYVLPLIMAATMFIQQKLSPTPPDPVQAKVMMIMPIAFSVFFFFFPAGLVLYWLVNNVLSILQQWRINHVIESASHAKLSRK